MVSIDDKIDRFINNIIQMLYKYRINILVIFVILWIIKIIYI